MRQHTGFLFAGSVCFAVALLLQLDLGDQKVQATPTPSSDYDDIFDAELEKNLSKNHEIIMSALEGQADTLSRIEQGLGSTEAPALKAPVRMSTTRWSVEGSWSPSKEKLLEHLAEHGVSANADYTAEELHIMHDNVHNGYPAMGGEAVNSRARSRTKTVTRSFRLFNGRLFRSRSYSSCSGGSCR